MQHALMETSRPIQCYYCRQRVSPRNSNERLVVCPGCNLEIKVERSNIFDNSSTANEAYGQVKGFCPTKSLQYMNFMRKRTETSPKRTSLNSKPSPLQRSPPTRPKKRAVLCGVSYKETKYKLKGTINDVKNMRDLLITKFGYQSEGILVLTDEEEEHHPTKKNIEKALKWLVKDCEKGESLVFYFSGHGLRQPDFNGDEIDGFDETICPVDFMKEGMILDNYINTTIVKPLIQGVTLHAIVDACHSGTILDLVYIYNRKTRKWEENIPPSGVNKATNGGLAISLSACEDDQVASDTSAFTRKTMNGVLTFILIDIVKKYPGLTYGDLLDLIQETIDEVNSSRCLISSNFFKKFFNNRITQRVQLSSSEIFNVSKRTFRL
ncbi:metacaspase-1-like isoform X2 [Pistacia vera]|uniref:metacaspase-1-like isoform X2 n=1 Tax=Pistacia vera TaxID=55513 RepID=UPI001263B8B3|nr:metacaspase-1-like isoform X2 [Pistacia vera]XP_031283295.1 metacaspase-1-like isoform X2 [Pistacia vera]